MGYLKKKKSLLKCILDVKKFTHFKCMTVTLPNGITTSIDQF